MSLDKFFNETLEQSLVKTTIVSKYFWAWANVVMPNAKRGSNKIAYIDLFSGPGRYDDGTKSTPLLILEQAIAHKDMRNMLVTIFNDKDISKINSLEKAINELPKINNLKYKPQIEKSEVGSEVVKKLESVKLVPTLFFVDPWGYKGLSLRLINSVLKDWGCDCIVFFNYNRINMGLTNKAVKEPMDALFGEQRASKLRIKLEKLTSIEREFTIIEEIVEALQEMGGKYALPFCFKNATGNRTKHHLIFVSKHFKGYEIMKEIMAKESSKIDQGVSSFEYCPADKKQLFLFELTRPLDELGELLLKTYAGKKITMKSIYCEHSIGKRYLRRNYKDILMLLEKQGKIKAIPSAKDRRKCTFGDDVFAIFPKR
ncbi:MAG: three-Cys-motif partner protein TcmP [Melioribacteraceae bacterium]|nr:three-Cys-motif partner protein TcmP [Candidatus Omnitrophota bacterium]MCF8357065.1 three-Cys-motif partner protein TcmP [Melioribacteraceae bacterium]